MESPKRSDVRRLLEQHGLSPSRARGQNFVCDPNTIERIVRLSRLERDDVVLEIGAGLGSLTVALAGRLARLTAIEVDRGLCEVLRTIVPPNVEVIEADAMTFDFGEHLRAGPAKSEAVLVANLPYNIATPLLLRLLEHVPQITRMVVMVQREVGERLAAEPGTKAYGASTVRLSYFATARIIGRVSAEVFFPRPHVDSVLVEIERRRSPAVDASEASYEEISALVRAGFSGRRKMLRRSLEHLVDDAAFAQAGIAPTERAERLDVVAFGKLAGCQRTISSSRTPN